MDAMIEAVYVWEVKVDGVGKKDGSSSRVLRVRLDMINQTWLHGIHKIRELCLVSVQNK